MAVDILRDDLCFACGKDNDKGLHLEISYPSPGKAESSLTVPDYFSGWKGITHGGFLSLVLDELMAHACLGEAPHAVTAEMTVRFLRAVTVGSRITVRGTLLESKGRVLKVEGRVTDEAGQAAAEATARFVKT
jgi:uncharacterized protein (TIGR00369 family)